MILFKRKKGTPTPSDAQDVGQPIVNLDTGELYIKTSTSTITNVCENEANIARNAESALNSRVDGVTSGLSAEVTRATGKESELNTAIGTNATAIAAEETRAKGVEGGLDTRLTQAEADIDAAENDILKIKSGNMVVGMAINLQNITFHV